MRSLSDWHRSCILVVGDCRLPYWALKKLGLRHWSALQIFKDVDGLLILVATICNSEGEDDAVCAVSSPFYLILLDCFLDVTLAEPLVFLFFFFLRDFCFYVGSFTLKASHNCKCVLLNAVLNIGLLQWYLLFHSARGIINPLKSKRLKLVHVITLVNSVDVILRGEVRDGN